MVPWDVCSWPLAEDCCSHACAVHSLQYQHFAVFGFFPNRQPLIQPQRRIAAKGADTAFRLPIVDRLHPFIAIATSGHYQGGGCAQEPVICAVLGRSPYFVPKPSITSQIMWIRSLFPHSFQSISPIIIYVLLCGCISGVRAIIDFPLAATYRLFSVSRPPAGVWIATTSGS